ncbi:nitrous oxide reductase accessory protein NosL [Desulfobacula sp.]|uniref:nitrous oxide reductase accessory protein NosL n=1 Tax=Desulfobacula sp. TaxID=2593537 RepID=UPI0026016EF1|nr:nitrous oxide reductase accessory protein NosL [Desulfobacula sp.]
MSAISRRNALNMIAYSFAVLLLPTGLTCASDGSRPQSGILPLDEHKQMQVSPGDRCPVCGMTVIRYPKFNCAIQLKNTVTYYFCSTGCMIRSWMHPEIYLGTAADRLHLPVVKEYFSGRQVDARDIIFVYGSDVIGPMGPALVPVNDENYLTVFKKRHGGKTQFLLKNLTDVKWYEMTGRKMVK